MIEAADVVWPAPAKLNLFLHVCGQRTDGYHELQTLFQLTDFCDELVIEPNPDGTIERSGGLDDVPAESDLVVRAARLLQSESGCRQGARITLKKNIPAGAGLGGGSSDAATVLLVLNALWGCDLSTNELASLGLKLGADVPLFVKGHTALAEGVGEILHPVDLGEQHYVLVQMPVHISTAELFRHPDLRRDCPYLSREEALAGAGFNAFEALVARLYPPMAKALADLSRYGVPRMTGTGSALFLQMPDAKAAMKATLELNSLYNVRAVRGQDGSPLHRMLRQMTWNGRSWYSAGTSPSW